MCQVHLEGSGIGKKNKQKKNISSDFSRNNEILNFERVYNPHDIPAVRRGLGGQG